jgi:hypothetical protein
LNKRSYVKAIDNIYFDLKHDSNDAINDWFDMMLNMADEQIYSSSNKLDLIDDYYVKDLSKDSKKMRVRSLIK